MRNAAEHQIALDAADAARAAAERNNANIVEDARAQLDAAEALRSNLSDGLEAARGGAAEARAATEAATAAEDAAAIAIERAERIDELERSLAEAVALQVARAELESLARERDAALAGLDTAAKRDHDDALARAAATPGRRAVRPRRRAGGAPRRRRGPRAEGRGASYEMVLAPGAAARPSASWCCGGGGARVYQRHGARGRTRRRAAASRAPRRSDLYDASSTSARRSVEYMGSRGPRPRGEAAARLGDAPQAPRAPVLGQWRRSAAERRRQNMALEALVKRRASNVLGQWRRRAAAKRRQSIALEALAKSALRMCGALAPTRGGDGADEERGAAARAVPAWVAPPRHVPRFPESGAAR